MRLFPDRKEFAALDLLLYSVSTLTPYFVEGRRAKLVRIHPATGKVTEYDVPSP